MRHARGFTLIEVLVALGIVAIALVAGLQATAALTTNAQRQSDTLLAHLCAENELARLRLGGQFPDVGESDVNCDQAGHALRVHVKISTTPNPNFRRVDVQAFDGQSPLVRLSTVQGRF